MQKNPNQTNYSTMEYSKKNLPKNKRGVVGLTYIFGIGRSTS